MEKKEQKKLKSPLKIQTTGGPRSDRPFARDGHLLPQI